MTGAEEWAAVMGKSNPRLYSDAGVRTRRAAQLGAEEPEFAADFVLVDDRGRVAVADAVLVGEPVGALFTAEEGGAGFEVGEPLGQLAPRLGGDTGDEALVHVGGVRQRHWHLRVGSRFQSRLPHRMAAGKTQPQPSCNVLFVIP